MSLRLSYRLLDERDVHQGSVGVNELEHEGLRDQVILVLRVRAVVFLDRAFARPRADDGNKRNYRVEWPFLATLKWL